MTAMNSQTCAGGIARDTLMELRMRLIAGLAVSLTPAVVSANSVTRHSSVQPRLLTEVSADDLCRAGFQSECRKLSPTTMDARKQIQFLGTAPTSPQAITAPITPPPIAVSHASAGEDAHDRLIAKERELDRREASLKAREAMLAAAAQSAQRAVPQPGPAPSPEWARLKAEDALISLTAATSVKRW